MEFTHTRTLNLTKTGICDGEIRVIDARTHNDEKSHFEQCSLCLGGGMVTVKRTVVIEVYPKHTTHGRV